MEEREEEITMPLSSNSYFVYRTAKARKCQLDFSKIMYLAIKKIFIEPLISFKYVDEKRNVFIETRVKKRC
jgi:hypothetical protein